MKQIRDPEDKLFDAGIEAIAIGVDDFQSEDRGRRAASIRNLYAGVLLLCKHLLVQHSPEDNRLLLIAAKTEFFKNKRGELRQTAKGNRTIDASELISRLNSIVPGLDTCRLENLRKHRNNIEHYFSDASDHILLEAFLNVQLFVSDLLVRLGCENPLGPDWFALVRKSAAFSERRDLCHQDLNRIKWSSKTVATALAELDDASICECGSNHIKRKDPSITEQHEVELVCMACERDVQCKDLIESTLGWRFGFSDYEAAKSGEPYSLYECPDCQSDNYLREEEQCAYCGYVEESACEHCGESLGIAHASVGDSMHDDCAYIDYVMSKD